MVLTIDGRREGYALNQIGGTMTVDELIDYLDQYDDKTLVMINNDDGYTYGSIDYDSFREEYDEDEDKDVITIDGRREGYAPSQIGGTMTVSELIDYLNQFNGEIPVMINNDNGYTYGSIDYDSFREEDDEDEEDDWEDEEDDWEDEDEEE